MNEEFAINFPSDYLLHLQQPGGFHTAYEEPYTHVQSNAWKPEERIAVLPVLVDTQKDYKILISESDLADYPCMFSKERARTEQFLFFLKLRLRLPKIVIEA